MNCCTEKCCASEVLVLMCGVQGEPQNSDLQVLMTFKMLTLGKCEMDVSLKC